MRRPGLHRSLSPGLKETQAMFIRRSLKVAAVVLVLGVVKGVDVEKRAIPVRTSGGRGGRDRAEAPADETRTYTIAAKAEIAIDDGRGKIFSVKEAKIADLPQGALVTLRVSVDQKEVQ